MVILLIDVSILSFLMKLDLVPNAEQDVKESKVQSSKSA